jgi:hypothetical protein
VRVAALPMVVVMLLAACARGDAGSPGPIDPDDASTTPAAEESTATSGATDDVSGGTDVESYLVAVSNLVGEARNLSQACQEEVSGEQAVSEESPLDEIERFLLDAEDLGCDGEEVVEMARELFCAAATAPAESASLVVIEQVCEGRG